MTADLIKRLESAEEGSRELDEDIDCLIRGRMTHPCLPAGFTMTRSDDWVRNASVARAQYIHQNRGPSPRYTTSIDAALTLVPEGFAIEANFNWEDGNHVSLFELKLLDGEIQYLSSECRTGACWHAKTPALAICAAALKAINAK